MTFFDSVRTTGSFIRLVFHSRLTQRVNIIGSLSPLASADILYLGSGSDMIRCNTPAWVLYGLYFSQIPAGISLGCSRRKLECSGAIIIIRLAGLDWNTSHVKNNNLVLKLIHQMCVFLHARLHARTARTHALTHTYTVTWNKQFLCSDDIHLFNSVLMHALYEFNSVAAIIC